MRIAANPEREETGILYVRGLTLSDIGFIKKYATNRNMTLGALLGKITEELRKGDSTKGRVARVARKATRKRK